MQKVVFFIILLIISTISLQIAYSSDIIGKEVIRNPFNFILSLINIINNLISGASISEITGNVAFDPLITIFVDNSLSLDCIGQYNPDNLIGNRCDGSDVFDAYNTLQEAANLVIPGDTVYVRGGNYYAPISATTIPVVKILRNGNINERIIFQNYREVCKIVNYLF